MIDDCVRRQDVIQAIYNNKDRLNICEAVRRLEPAYPASYDCISRQAVLDTIHLFFTEEIDKIPTKKTEDGEVLVIHKCQPLFAMNKAICKRIKALPSVPAEQTHEEWCTDCKEYDQEQHCCHRYCKVIRETVDEIKQAERTGHWIRQDNTKEPLYGWYFCSECNSVIGDKTKFCSNCGCAMIEPQESEEV